MRVIARNDEYDSSQVTYRPMNYGQRITDIPIFQFRIEMSLLEFITKFGPEFDEFVEEMREDDKIGGIEPIPEMVMHAYAPLRRLVEVDFNAVAAVTLQYLNSGLVQRLFGYVEHPELVINRVVAICLKSDQVVITGEAYEPGR